MNLISSLVTVISRILKFGKKTWHLTHKIWLIFGEIYVYKNKMMFVAGNLPCDYIRLDYNEHGTGLFYAEVNRR